MPSVRSSARTALFAVAPLALLVALFTTACETTTEIVTVTDTLIVTDTVEVDRPRYEEVPAAAGGFVGYRSSTSAGEATCGQCHASAFSGWMTTGHAEAWAGLQGSGGAQEFCEGCHTVNARGNTSEADAGWIATGDDRYHDVQCESCHGPGQDHIDVPDANAGPLAQVGVSLDPLTGCGQCHNGTHHPFVEEWSESPHADIVGFAAARESCASCHRGQGVLLAWGVNSNYVEKFGDALATTCAVCHASHGSENPGNTRFSARASNIEANLCAKCHNRRTEPDAESSHGLAPHAPQAPLLVGTAGWFPPGMSFEPGQILGTHGTENNEEFCATCHVNSYTVTDEGGNFVKNVTGHLFTSVPCTDENGLPVSGDCEYTTDARTYGACTASGCHGTEAVAASALAVASLRIADRAGTVLDLLWQVDPNLDGPGGEIDPGDGIFTTAEGAFFNVNLAQFPGREGSSEPGDNPGPTDATSAATHNPFLVEALLIGSQSAVEDEYGVGGGGAVDYAPQIREILEKARRHNGFKSTD